MPSQYHVPGAWPSSPLRVSSSPEPSSPVEVPPDATSEHEGINDVSDLEEYDDSSSPGEIFDFADLGMTLELIEADRSGWIEAVVEHLSELPLQSQEQTYAFYSEVLADSYLTAVCARQSFWKLFNLTSLKAFDRPVDHGALHPHIVWEMERAQFFIYSMHMVVLALDEILSGNISGEEDVRRAIGPPIQIWDVAHPITGTAYESSTEVCSICMDEENPENRVRTYACGHLFHEDCILHWINGDEEGILQENGNFCPVCRE